MSRKYQQMLPSERDSHHDQLRADGYEWCPECGEPLVWELSDSCPEPDTAVARNPVVVGDCPPLTREQLATTNPT